MDIYDASANTFTQWSEISQNFSSYRYFLNGAEIFPSEQMDILKIITNLDNKFPLLVCRKQKDKKMNDQVESVLSSNQFGSHFTPSQWEMYQTHPSALFQTKLWNFKYAMERQAAEVSKEREQQLRSELIEGNPAWKDASLQELEVISRNYSKMIEDTLRK